MVTEMLLAAAVANTIASTAATQNDLDIKDYIGIVALAATAITFFLTYRHGTQSEQTRIARDRWKKVSEKNNKSNEILEKYKEQYEEIGNIVKDFDISKTRIELDKRCIAAKKD
jgi:hypothetical protein